MTLRRVHAPLLLCLVATCWFTPAQRAAAADADTLKTTIEDFLHRAELSSEGRVHWDGADTFEVKTDGAAATATIANAHFSFRQEPGDAKPLATLTLDRVEIIREPAAQGGNLDQLTITLPALATLVTDEGREIALRVKSGRATALLETPDDRQRAGTIAFDSARVEDRGGKSWAGFGPFASSWKIVRGDDGGWHSPLDFELKGLEFLIDEAPLAGGVERIAYSADANGPNLAEFDALRDRMNQIRTELRDKPEQKGEAWLPVLTKILTVFSASKGELTIERVSAKRPGGATLVTLDKAALGGSFSGLTADNAEFRIRLSHDGLTIAPSLVDAVQVPRRAVFEFGVEKLAVGALRTIAEAAAKSATEASDEDRQTASVEMLAGAMLLNPVVRVYEASAEFPDVGVTASGEVHRAPPAPIGYAATGEVAVRGFDALAGVLTAPFAREVLPLLKFIGSAGSDAAGHPVAKFALTSTIGRPIAVNNSDLANWFGAAPPHAAPAPGAPPRLLRLADPPLEGDDVRAVQKAVVTQQVEPFKDAVYDTATRDKLGLKPPPPAVPNAARPTVPNVAPKN
jgi:hypothetical protein